MEPKSFGGEARAVILSLVQTCRGLGINPREYLEDIMRRLMGHNAQKLNELMPDQWLKTSCSGGLYRSRVIPIRWVN